MAWLIENGTIVALAFLRKFSMPMPTRKNIFYHYFYNIAGGMLTTELSIYIQYLFVTRLYKHIPYFQKDGKGLPKSFTNFKLALKDWATVSA